MRFDVSFDLVVLDLKGTEVTIVTDNTMILFSVRMPEIKVFFVIVENTYEITFVIMRSTIAQDYFVCCCNYGTGLVLLPHSIRSSELWCLFSQWSIHHSWE